MKIPKWAVPVIAALAAGFFVGGATAKDSSLFGQTVAAWIQAIGSIGAIYWASRMARRQRAHEIEMRRQVAEKEDARMRMAARAAGVLTCQRLQSLSEELRESAKQSWDVAAMRRTIEVTKTTIRQFRSMDLPTDRAILIFDAFPGALAHAEDYLDLHLEMLKAGNGPVATSKNSAAAVDGLRALALERLANLEQELGLVAASG
ncbi:hypothetical protein [Caulobacter sp. 602-1]|uniref:hypothetical protein n=1 Tax=Caulobacter sp. 602-1 TaxID=2492472 RepID=UPI000F642EAC|nr:hypothetical protein [Caulobacter sp. 602-1]RRN64675.1 hypothetical protein EIK80_11610 [Caulobacter sp. 602-1]